MKLFAYGTLNDEWTQTSLFGRPVASVPATLVGWKMDSFQSGIRFIVPSPNDRVEGYILQDLGDEEIFRADQYEGDAYQRVKVRIDGEDVYVYRLDRGLRKGDIEIGLLT